MSVPTISQAGDRLHAAVERGDLPAVQELIPGLFELAGELIAGGDPDAVTHAEGQLAAWLSLLDRRGDAFADCVRDLQHVAVTLHHAGRIMRLKAVRHADEQAVRADGTLRERIMHVLGDGEALRTGEIAQRVGSSPAPVSRALRVLQSDGLLERRKGGGLDGRAVAYALVRVHAGAVAAA